MFQVLRDEFLAVQNQFDQLQHDYSRTRPAYLELEQQLETERRKIKQLEDELIQSKSIQLEMLNAEVERYNKSIKFY